MYRDPIYEPYYAERRNHYQDKYDGESPEFYTKFKEPEDMKKAMACYLEACIKEEKYISINGFSIFMNMTVQNLYKTYFKKGPKRKNLHLKFKQYGEQYLTESSLNGKVDSKTATLLLSANYNVVRKTEKTVNNNNNALPTKIIINAMSDKSDENNIITVD